MRPPSRARARRHRVLVMWLGVLLLTQRSISTTAAPRRGNHTNHTKNTNATNNINTTPSPNESHVTSKASIPTSIDSHVTSTTPNDSDVESDASDSTSNVSERTRNTSKYSRMTRKAINYDMLSIYLTINDKVVPVVASVGLAGNAISLAVWSGERTFNPATFFIKALSVADMVLLGARLMRAAMTAAYYQYSFAVDVFTRALYTCGMNSSAHLTLALVVSRWLSVHRPLRVHRLLTKRRTVASLALLLLWCGVLATLSELPYYGILDTYRNAYLAFWYTLRGVGVVPPVLILVFFSASLVRFMCRRSHHAGGISPSPSRRQREARATQLRRGVAAVVCVSVTTMLTYPVGMLTEILVISHTSEVWELCGMYCDSLIVSVVLLMEVFNSAVTPLYYAIFASRFRELFWSRYKSIRAACRNPPCVPAVRRARHGPETNTLQESSPCVLVEMQSTTQPTAFNGTGVSSL